MMVMVVAMMAVPAVRVEREGVDKGARIPVVHGGPRVPPQSSLCIRRAEQKHGHEKLNKGNFVLKMAHQRAFLGMKTQEGHYLI